MTKVIARVERVTADRTNYKQYSPQLAFDDLYVELEVPDGEITVKGDIGEAGGKVLTLKGFTTLLDTVATAVDAMHTAYQKRFQ